MGSFLDGRRGAAQGKDMSITGPVSDARVTDTRGRREGRGWCVVGI